VLYYMDYRFYQRILENSWILIKKNRDIIITKHFQNSVVYYLFFNFLVFLTSFFLVYLSMVFKKFLKFVLFYCMDPSFYQEILQNYVFFFKKIWDIWTPELQQNSIVYYFYLIFLAFLAFFFYFTYPNLSKNFGVFCSVLFEGLEILLTNSGNF